MSYRGKELPLGFNAAVVNSFGPRFYQKVTVRASFMQRHLQLLIEWNTLRTRKGIYKQSVVFMSFSLALSSQTNVFSMDELPLKWNLRSKKSQAQMKEREKWKKKRAMTDLNAPNCSRGIPFQSQEFGQDGHRHFLSFQPHFQLNMTSQTQCRKTLKK